VASMRAHGLPGLALLAAVAAASCSPAPAPPPFSMPPASAGADVVLDAYLRALVAGDCADGRRLATAAFARGNGELCGDTRVSDYKVNPAPARPNAAEAVYATTITTSGTPDGSVLPGAMTWFYDLVRQPGGAWRIAGGGSGP
jgi:hypothetical protein